MVKRLSFNRRDYFTAAGVIGLVALLVTTLNFAWSSIVDPIEPGLRTNESKTASAVDLASLDDARRPAFQSEMLINRPLFSPNRRPPVNAAPELASADPAAQTDTEPAPAYLIGGVIVSAGLHKTLLRKQPRETGRWLKLGETTDEGWTVALINSDGVTFARGSRKVTLSLYTRGRERPLPDLR